jgi:hypothetical protein
MADVDKGAIGKDTLHKVLTYNAIKEVPKTRSMLCSLVPIPIRCRLPRLDRLALDIGPTLWPPHDIDGQREQIALDVLPLGVGMVGVRADLARLQLAETILGIEVAGSREGIQEELVVQLVGLGDAPFHDHVRSAAVAVAGMRPDDIEVYESSVRP